MVVALGVLGPVVLALLRALGVEGVRGAMRGWVVELVGVRGVMRGWGVDGALVLPDIAVCGAEGAVPLGVVGFPQPSKVLRVILRG